MPTPKELVDEALRDVADQSVPASVILDKAVRIARLRRDGRNLLWLVQETHSSGDQHDRDRLADELRSYFADEREFRGAWNAELEAYLTRRSFDPRVEGSELYGGSVAEMEEQIDALGESAEETRDMPTLRSQALLRRSALRSVRARVRTRLMHYLSEVEAQLQFDERVSDIFETQRAYVDGRLLAVSPGAFEQLAAAYARRNAGDVEARSHAVTSCRRAFKSLADALYPARKDNVVGADGEQHAMTDDKFVNRLIQFVGERRQYLAEAEGDLLLAQIPLVGTKLNALNNLSSKGVHAAITDAEVDHCIIETYLTIGDILRLAEQIPAEP